jgi:hypothetical protein
MIQLFHIKKRLLNEINYINMLLYVQRIKNQNILI